jgi:threonine synthase
MDEPNPFLRYRERLDSYARARAAGLADDWFVATVRDLDARVAVVDGHGFAVTPLRRATALAEAAGLGDVELWVKDETVNVAGAHKARHLFGLALHLAVDAATSQPGPLAEPDLAIASCGNAALGAAVVARAMQRRLRVFIPTNASPAIVARLEALGADITECPRRPGESGDPAYLRFREALGAGAVAFSCQGTDAPATLDGGRTLGWELADQFVAAVGAPARLDRVFVQIGGGALATSCWRGLADGVADGRLAGPPALHAVQTEGAHPLARAWDLLMAAGGPDPLVAARAHPERYMWAWETEPVSIATGILDDVTYDWLGVVEAMLAGGGSPVLADEATLARAERLLRSDGGIDADATGAAGLAGLLTRGAAAGERVVVLATGARRHLRV